MPNTQSKKLSNTHRSVLSISLPPMIASEYRKIAELQGESISQLFREMFALYRQEKIRNDFYKLQEYGREKAKEQNITEEMIEKLVFEDR